MRALKFRWLAPGNLSLCRDLFWEIGGFDEDFPVAGAEDQEFSLRARAAGCRLVLDTRIVCDHNDNRLTLQAYLLPRGAPAPRRCLSWPGSTG